ncbi:MAG: DNA-binding response regulator [Chloroflexi bacterium]|jgi:DNA-binding response OmpR family regulator|nr:DNA-binding response regulator [Chloroflexota bacterium]
MGTSENGNQARKIKIMLVEDEQPIVDFLTLGLNYEGFEVQSCLDGGLALGLAADFKPDLVVLDLMLPGMDGLEIARRLRAGSDLGIIILTAREDSQTTVKGLNLGADDYVIKPFDFPVLVARIRSVLRRKGQLQEDTLTVGDVTLNRNSHEVRRGDQPVELTNKEFELLEMLMDHPRQVFSRETILNRVWGYDFAGNTNVVDVYISYLRDKLEGKDESSRLIHTVRGVGYTFRPN